MSAGEIGGTVSCDQMHSVLAQRRIGSAERPCITTQDYFTTTTPFLPLTHEKATNCHGNLLSRVFMVHSIQNGL